jgi:hypothetical protein
MNRRSAKELKMKVHVLAATVVAALASRAVLALSEGGDTWSAIQVVGQQDERLPQFMPRVHPPVTRQIVWEGSEDGDPCPELGVLKEQAAAEADLQHRVAPVDAARALSGSGSEGGDTWSRFLPRPQARPTRTAGLIFAPEEIK